MVARCHHVIPAPRSLGRWLAVTGFVLLAIHVELGYSAWFNHGVVWLQFGPTLALLAWEAWRSTRREPHPSIEAMPAHES